MKIRESLFLFLYFQGLPFFGSIHNVGELPSESGITSNHSSVTCQTESPTKQGLPDTDQEIHQESEHSLGDVVQSRPVESGSEPVEESGLIPELVGEELLIGQLRKQMEELKSCNQSLRQELETSCKEAEEQVRLH